jgi:aminomethyltransferase
MVEFAGFEMPLHYGSILEEHAAVRERAGLFDVSHMGQIHLSGAGAIDAAERLLSCQAASLRVGRVRYGLLCNQDGGVVDDVTSYRLAPDAMMLCVNAANIEKDYRWVVRHSPAEAEVRNRSAETGLLALQGPRSAEILAAASEGAVHELRRFRFSHFSVAGVEALISRTGYTGADGFEIYLPAARTAEVFDALLERGASRGLVPVGLGARDTLRLEAALPLYGHELDDKTSPLDAGLERFVKREAGGFIGAEAIEQRATSGHTRRLIGFELVDRGVARAGHPISHRGEVVGRVSSGGHSPTLGKSIGLGYVPPALATPGADIEVLVRERGIAARVVETPFVKTGGPGAT